MDSYCQRWCAGAPGAGLRIVGLGHHVLHDANVGVVSPAGVEFAVSEERLSRHKQDGRFPRLALDFVGTQDADVVVAPYFDAQGFEAAHRDPALRPRRDRFRETQRIREQALRDVGVTEFVGHHFSHAAGAYYTGGFSEALVVTYDAGIDCEPWFATVWRGMGATLTPLRRLTLHDGATAALRYSGITAALGYQPGRDEGKVTGLAACGRPDERCLDALNRAFLAFEAESPRRTYTGAAFAARCAGILAEYSARDIAASLQQMTEDTVTSLIAEFAPDPTKVNLVLAGGLFANVLLNLRIKDMGFRSLYVYPAMGDEGLGLGAALASAVARGIAPRALTHVFLGPGYDGDEVRRSLERTGLRFERCDDVEIVVARRLAEGHTVGRFAGRCEFGPRALGNRSILYRADDRNVGAWLNRQLRRSDTMPFAPVTIDDLASELFEGLDGVERCTPFMTTAVRCTKRMHQSSPAVVHVDGTARVQIASLATAPSLHRVISEYHSLTGMPCLLNTSFNVHGEPIVCSPDDAVRSFLAIGLDCLAIGDFLVERPR